MLSHFESDAQNIVHLAAASVHGGRAFSAAPIDRQVQTRVVLTPQSLPGMELEG